MLQRGVNPAVTSNRGSACSTSGRAQHLRSSLHRSLQLRPAKYAANAANRRQQQIHGQWILLRDVQENDETSMWSRFSWELVLLACSLPALPAAAEEGVKYNPEGGEGLVKTLSGAVYIALLLYFLFRVFNRRARKAREEVRRQDCSKSHCLRSNLDSAVTPRLHNQYETLGSS